MRSVRLEAIRALLEVSTDTWSDADRKTYLREREELRASLVSNADRPEALLELARLGLTASSSNGALNTTANAEALLRKALALDPTPAATYVNLADFLRGQGKERDAIDVLKRGLDKAGDRASLEYALGLALVRLGDKPAALGHLRTAQELAPRSARLGYVYAVALYDSGETQKAIALLERLYARFDGDLQLLGTLVQYQARAGDAARASELEQQLIRAEKR